MNFFSQQDQKEIGETNGRSEIWGIRVQDEELNPNLGPIVETIERSAISNYSSSSSVFFLHATGEKRTLQKKRNQKRRFGFCKREILGLRLSSIFVGSVVRRRKKREAVAMSETSEKR